MSYHLRIAAIVVGIALIYVLLFLNKRVITRYWEPALENVESADEDE